MLNRIYQQVWTIYEMNKGRVPDEVALPFTRHLQVIVAQDAPVDVYRKMLLSRPARVDFLKRGIEVGCATDVVRDSFPECPCANGGGHLVGAIETE